MLKYFSSLFNLKYNYKKKMEITKGEDETFAKKTRKIVLVIAAYW